MMVCEMASGDGGSRLPVFNIDRDSVALPIIADDSIPVADRTRAKESGT